MARNQKLLHELLKEDQEPFVLNKHISDKCSQMKRPFPKTCLQTRKRKSINYKTSNFPGNLCKNACLFSFPDTPDFRKSPLFEFASPVKSPCKSPNAIFLHIPSRTATLLLEAALRVQNKQSSPSSKPKSHGFGLFGSLFKRLKQRKREIEGSGGKVSVKWDPSVERRKVSSGIGAENQRVRVDANVPDVGLLRGRSSSAVWSESNEDKSLDMEITSSSGNSDDHDSEGTHQFGNTHTECACCHHGFCESPFRFVLQTTPSSGSHTPELLSPSRHRTEEKESNEAESLNKLQTGEEEDKEQCSPVSVLDPPFEDDDEGHGNDEMEEEEEEKGYDLESSYAIVQRAKQQLLYKLRRFEKLAELDPVELEKRMMEQDEDEDEAFMEENYREDEDSEASYKENDYRELVFEALSSRDQERNQIPEEFKKLVSDLIMEEEREMNSFEEKELVIKRICKRLELWKEVECNTIDMMIEEDFSREDGEWKKNVEQVKKMAGELELAIFGFLVEEFSEELVC